MSIRLHHDLTLNPSWTSLNLSNKHLNAKSAKIIAQFLRVNTALKELNLSCNPLMRDGVKVLFKALHKNTTLKTLNLAFTQSGYIYQSVCSNFFFNDLSKPLFKLFQKNCTLTTLKMTCNGFNPNESLSIANGIQCNTSLTQLDISHNMITGPVLNRFLEAVIANTTLKDLNISSCFDIDIDGQFFHDILTYQKSLSSLHFASIRSPSSVRTLIDALQFNETLTSLSLLTSNMNDELTEEFSRVLLINTNITSLNLSSNSIGDHGTQIISRALRSNHTLTQLNLGNNKIRNKGVKEICNTLLTNTTLTLLNIASNKFNLKGTRAIGKALELNSTLMSLNLNFVRIGDDGAISLANALLINTTLRSLDLSYTMISQSNQEMIELRIWNHYLQHVTFFEILFNAYTQME